jgi:hypothetical protein
MLKGGDGCVLGVVVAHNLQAQCLRTIADFLWQCLDAAKDDLLDVHFCKRKLLKSVPYLPEGLRVRIFAFMLARNQINPELLKSFTSRSEISGMPCLWTKY